MAIVIAGDRSGVGKTTVTLALLSFLSQQQGKVQGFKVGPDYIDPMFHTAITNRPCRNLDPVLTSEKYVQDCFARHSQGVDWVVVEGVMGLFDGIRNLETFDGMSQLQDYGSTAHIARLLNLPVVLVLDCSHLSSSIAAIAYGYANLQPRAKIAGVVLNRVASDRHLELLEHALTTVQLPILGVLRRDKDITIPDRHLGLIPTAELPQLNQICDHLSEIAKTCFNWEKLFPLLQTNPNLHSLYGRTAVRPYPSSNLRIAIAKDRAFNFYYQDNLDLLQELGAELVFWSPLRDETLPPEIAGLYFGGGFPEVFATQLAANQVILQQLQQLIMQGMPTYAECGGLMYLCEQLIDLDHQTHSLVGVIPAQTIMQKKITLGYRQAIALQASPLIKANQTIRGHEFHHSQLRSSASQKSLWQLQGFHRQSNAVTEGWQIAQVHASYLHVHFGEYRFLGQNFIQSCLNFKS